jgi:hypothetical protein
VVIDPLVTFYDSNIPPGNEQSVRRALAALPRLADQHGCVRCC